MCSEIEKTLTCRSCGPDDAAGNYEPRWGGGGLGCGDWRLLLDAVVAMQLARWRALEKCQQELRVHSAALTVCVSSLTHTLSLCCWVFACEYAMMKERERERAREKRRFRANPIRMNV